MGTKNKQNRIRKKRLRERKLRQKRIKDARPPSNSHFAPRIHSFSNPFDGLTEDEIRQRSKQVAEAAEREYRESLAQIEEILHQADPLGLISNLAAYSLTQGIGDNGITCRFDQRLNQSHIEICQALILRKLPSDLRWRNFSPQDVDKLIDVLSLFVSRFSFLDYDDLDSGSSVTDKNRSILKHLVKSHTTSVRNWGNFSQVVSISKDIYSVVDEDVRKKNGFSISEVIDLFLFMINTLETRLTGRLLFLRDLCRDPKNSFHNYCMFLGYTSEQADRMFLDLNLEGAPDESQKRIILSHSDQYLKKIFEFSPDDIDKKCKLNRCAAKSILDRFSFKLGELSEYRTEDIILSNPVWRQPVIKLEGDNYFCAMPQMFFSFIIPSLNCLVEELGERYSNKVSRKRSKFLENRVYEIVQSKFPNAQILSGLKWEDNGKNGETDLIVLEDSVALIVEVKSGKVSDAALRGAADRMKRDIQNLLVAPSEQSKRFKSLFERLSTHPEEKNKLRTNVPVDLGSIHKIIRSSVTLEEFAMIQSHLVRLKDTDWLPDDFEPCATLNLTDFETLFDILEKPIHILHYLDRRIALEQDLKIIGSERDFLGLYLDTLFNYGELGEHSSIVITEMSKKLDRYYESKEAGVLLQKPQPNVSKLFKGLLGQLEKRKPSRWIELGMCLNRLSPDDQNALNKMIQHLKTAVRKNWMIDGHKNAIIYSPPSSSEYALCYVVYCNKNADRRDDFILDAANDALVPGHVKYCVLIAYDMDQPEIAYTRMGLVEKDSKGPELQ